MRKFLFTIIILIVLLNIVKAITPVDDKIDYRMQQATCEKHGNIWNNITNECFYK